MIVTVSKIVISLGFLVCASWSDYRTREVSNRVWMLFAPIALALSLAEFLLFDMERLPWFGIVLGVIIAFALLLFYAGGFGGADSKALICIALALPFFPDKLPIPFFVEGLSPIAQNIFPFTIFSNSILVAAASVIVMLLVNIKQRLTTDRRVFEGTLAAEPVWKKILVLMTGYKVPLAKLQDKWHIYPMEDVEENNGESSLERKLVIMPKDEGREEIVGRLSRAIASGKIDSNVFATPGLPMLIFITVGLIISLLLGDVVWLIIHLLAG